MFIWEAVLDRNAKYFGKQLTGPESLWLVDEMYNNI